MARINLLVDDGIPEALSQLAGGERRMGIYLSKLIAAVAAGEQSAQSGGDVETLRLAFAGMVGKQKEVEGRLLQVERQLSALMASSQK
jgi:hypothetical protein